MNNFGCFTHDFGSCFGNAIKSDCLCILDIVYLSCSNRLSADHIRHCHGKILNVTQPRQMCSVARDTNRASSVYTLKKVAFDRIVITRATNVRGTERAPGQPKFLQALLRIQLSFVARLGIDWVRFNVGHFFGLEVNTSRAHKNILLKVWISFEEGCQGLCVGSFTSIHVVNVVVRRRVDEFFQLLGIFSVALQEGSSCNSGLKGCF